MSTTCVLQHMMYEMDDRKKKRLQIYVILYCFYIKSDFFFLLTLKSRPMWTPCTWLEPLLFFFCLWQACQPQRKAWQTWNLLFDTKGICFDVCQCDTRAKRKRKKATNPCEHVGIQNYDRYYSSLFLWKRLLKMDIWHKNMKTSGKKKR